MWHRPFGDIDSEVEIHSCTIAVSWGNVPRTHEAILHGDLGWRGGRVETASRYPRSQVFRLRFSRCLVIQLLRRLPQLLLSPLGISGRRVQIFMAEDLSQADQIIARVRKILMRHRVPQQVGMQVTPVMAEYLSHKARTPRSVSGPRSPTKTWLVSTGGRDSK